MPGLWIKVCGVTNLPDAQMAEEAGVNAIGLELGGTSPRALRLDQAAEIAAGVGLEVVVVARVLDADEARQVLMAVAPHRIQLERPPAIPLPIPWYRALSCDGREVISALREPFGDRFLLRLTPAMLPGGRLYHKDPGLIREVGRLGPLVLGGISTLEALRAAMGLARPAGVSLGRVLEKRPGVKDRGLLGEALEIIEEEGRLPASA